MYHVYHVILTMYPVSCTIMVHDTCFRKENTECLCRDNNNQYLFADSSQSRGRIRISLQSAHSRYKECVAAYIKCHPDTTHEQFKDARTKGIFPWNKNGKL